jgi:hypothetical protein
MTQGALAGVTRIPAGPPRDPAQCRAVRFTVALLMVSLVLQRLALSLGSSSVSLTLPAGLGLIAFGLLRGTLMLHRIRLLAYLALVGLVLLGFAWRATGAAGAATPSVPSMLQFLLLSAAGAVSFAEPVGQKIFFRAVNQCFLLIAVAGLLQFAAQFAGLRLFSFTGILPDGMLFEQGYNLQIPAGIGDLLKSNGFFLVEPSVFSQIMALGLMIEGLTTRRPRNLALFGAGLMVSFSGTGWIVLGAFVLAAPFRLGVRGLGLAAAMVVAVAGAAGLLVLLAPDISAAFANRLDEVLRPGTSGHMRFVTPYWLLGHVIGLDPASVLVGIGSGMAERQTLAYEYDVNTPVKVAVEFGLPALLAYLVLFTWARRTAVQGALLVPVMVLFLFTGGYQQFPPIVFIVLLLSVTARLRPDPPS